MRLSNKLLGQGYVKERLKSSLRKFYGRYGDLTKQYEVPLSRMLHDILDDDHIQWQPPLIGHYTNFWPLLIWTLLPNLTFYLIVQGFHRTYATGAAYQQRTLTPSGHLVLSHLGFAFVHQTETTLPTCDAYRIWYSPKFTLPTWRFQQNICTWSCPTLGLACVLMSRQSLLNLSCLRTFEFRTPLGTSLLLLLIMASLCKCETMKCLNPVYYESTWAENFIDI